MSDSIKCPFCGDGDYDLVGLKWHLTGYHIGLSKNGGCEAFDNTLTIEEERNLREAQKQYRKEHEEQI